MHACKHAPAPTRQIAAYLTPAHAIAPCALAAALTASSSDEKGIPDFWLQAMRHHEAIGPAITDNDAEVLEFVEDIKTGKLTGEEEEGFWLEFHFRDNPFFDNTVLRKEYVMIDEEEQLLDEARGTEIDWKKGKDVTTKLLKKKSKKGGPKGKVQTKREKVRTAARLRHARRCGTLRAPVRRLLAPALCCAHA